MLKLTGSQLKIKKCIYFITFPQAKYIKEIYICSLDLKTQFSLMALLNQHKNYFTGFLKARDAQTRISAKFLLVHKTAKKTTLHLIFSVKKSCIAIHNIYAK